MADDYAVDIARLQQLLPPIAVWDDYGETLRSFDSQVAIDCEWHSKRCKCGRDLPDGALETIGVGNEQRIVQVDWQSLDDYRRTEVRGDVEELVARVPVVYQNAIADLKVLRKHGFPIHPDMHCRLDDVMLADAVLDSEEGHDLESICTRVGVMEPWKHLQYVAPREYNAADLVAPIRLWTRHFEREFAKNPAAEWVYRELSIAFLAEIQLESEEAGIRIDKTKPYPLYDRLDAKRKQAVAMAAAYLGTDLLGLSSPKDMKHVLYTLEGLPAQYEKGPPQADRKLTTDKDAVAALRRWHGTEFDPDDEPTLEQAWANIEAGGHPVLEARYLFMGAQQAISHYVEPCLLFDAKGEITGVADRIYPEIRQHVQATGRHSYVGPAVQQMKGDVLTQLTPDVGTVWVEFDWSQIEVRLLAVLANDEPYLQAYARGEDIHERNRHTLFGPKPADPHVAETQRRFTKTFIFRLHYRGKAEHAGDIPGARLLGLSRDRLVEIASRYMDAHPAIVAYWAKLDEQVERYRVVHSFMGRPRKLTSEYKAARSREGGNHPMQAGVADIYIETALLIKRAAPYARLAHGRHDAQTWQVPAERAKEFRDLIEPIVARPFRINGMDVVFPAEFKPVKEAA